MPSTRGEPHKSGGPRDGLCRLGAVPAPAEFAPALCPPRGVHRAARVAPDGESRHADEAWDDDGCEMVGRREADGTARTRGIAPSTVGSRAEVSDSAAGVVAPAGDTPVGQKRAAM